MTQIFRLYGPVSKSNPVIPPRTPQPKDDLPARLETSDGDFEIARQVLNHGPGAGVELLTIRGTQAEFTVLPTRGMGIWRAKAGVTEFGWRSPVQGPIHPTLVPIDQPNGLGWLAGFDELLVRCGMESNGAPEFDANHRLRYPLHGRIANLPAESLTVTIEPTTGVIEITGVVREASLFFTNWSLKSTIRMHVESDTISITDQVINHSDAAKSHQLLYHINCGSPVLDRGAKLVAPAIEVVPKTPRAVEGLKTYDIYGAPEVGFSEQVYLMRLQADDHGWSQALLHSSDKAHGLGVRFDTTTLPYFIQWKNTGGENDGYVTGLEPATNFPNTRTFEESHGRVVHTEPDSSVSYHLELCLLSGSERVNHFEAETKALLKQPASVELQPRKDWCE